MIACPALPYRQSPAAQPQRASEYNSAMDDDDFTFPTVAAARGPTALLGRRDDDPVPHLLQLPPLPSPNLVGASPLWPFAGSILKRPTAPPSSPPVTADDEQERSAVAEEEEDHRVAADEDRMDLLWEETPTTSRPVASAPAPESRSVAGPHAGPPPPKQRAAVANADDDKQRAAALADAERMDKLWESFNEDLVVLRHRDRGRRRRRAKSAADHLGIDSIKVSRTAGGLDGPADDEDDHWYLCHYYSPSSGGGDEESDQETASASSPAERRGYGCAPTMLRASSRAGGACQFCAASPRARRRRGRGAAAGWELLLRLFRRLFAVDRTAPSPSRSHSSIYMP